MNTISENHDGLSNLNMSVTTRSKVIANIKREYWEHKKIILGLPIALGALLIAVSLIAIIFFGSHFSNLGGEFNFYFDSDNINEQSTGEQLDFSTDLVPYDGQIIEQLIKGPDHNTGDDSSEQDGFDFKDKGAELFFLGIIAAFMTVAWIACIYYLMETLNTDRKDKSILFWKSLPVSESQNVITKLLMGTVGFVGVSVLIAWLVSFVLFIIGLIGAYFLGESFPTESIFSLSIVGDAILFSILSLIFGMLWGGPIFTYALMVSAIAKRSSFLWLILPPIALVLVEGIVFKSKIISDFIFYHMPFNIFGGNFDLSSISSVFQFFIIENGGRLVFCLLLSIIFTLLAIWFRNNRFEV